MISKPRPQAVRMGQLDCWVVDGGPAPQIPVVLCHGYGAPGSDLVGLAFSWLESLGSAGEMFQFVFPAAPGDLSHMGMPDGRAWWPINMARLAEAVNAQRFEELHGLEPQGIETARTLLVEAIEQIQINLAAPQRRLVLGGFSQGAMLTIDTSLRGLATAPDLLLVYSGTLVCETYWAENASKLNRTAIYQSHGTRDPILPYDSAVALRDLLTSGGATVDFHSFVGPHTIDQASIDATSRHLAKLVSA